MARSEGREPIWLVDILSRTRKGFGRGSACGAYGKQQSLCGQMESNCQLAYNSTNWMPRTATAAKRYTTSRRYKFPGEEVEIHAYTHTYTQRPAVLWLDWRPVSLAFEHFTSSKGQRVELALGNSPLKLVTKFSSGKCQSAQTSCKWEVEHPF